MRMHVLQFGNSLTFWSDKGRRCLFLITAFTHNTLIGFFPAIKTSYQKLLQPTKLDVIVSLDHYIHNITMLQNMKHSVSATFYS